MQRAEGLGTEPTELRAGDGKPSSNIWKHRPQSGAHGHPTIPSSYHCSSGGTTGAEVGCGGGDGGSGGGLHIFVLR